MVQGARIGAHFISKEIRWKNYIADQKFEFLVQLKAYILLKERSIMDLAACIQTTRNNKLIRSEDHERVRFPCFFHNGRSENKESFSKEKSKRRMFVLMYFISIIIINKYIYIYNYD